MFNQFSFEIRKRRDFGQLIGDSFNFIKINIKGLLRSIVIIAGPFLFITAAYGAYFQLSSSSVFWSNFLFSNNAIRSSELIFRAILNYLFIQLGAAILHTVFLDYTKLVLKNATGKISNAEVWKEVKHDLWKVVLLYIINLLILAAAVSLFVVFIGAGMYLAIPLLIVLFVFIYVRFAFAQTVCVIQNCTVFQAISYSWRYSYSEFWATFGLLVVLYIITTLFGYIFLITSIIPFISREFFPFMTGTFAMQAISFMLTIISTIGQRLISLFFYSGIAMQYFNIVEKEQGVGLREKLDLIGKIKPRQFWNDEAY